MTLRRRGLPTLRGRVSRLALGVIAAWLVVLAACFDLVLLTRLDNQIDDALRVRAQAASATIVAADGRITAIRESTTDGALDSSIWVFSGGRVLERPGVTPAVRRVAATLVTRPRGYVEGADHRFYVLPVERSGTRIGTILASRDLDPLEDTRNTVILGSALVVVLLLAGAYPALRYATGRALQPVDRMTRQAADWSVTAPGQRFGDGQRYDELSSLARTLDELLDRLAAVLRHERHLSAELSHELRTPLARVTAQVDLVRAGARPDQLAELDAIRDDCAAMDSTIEALLAAARSELTGTVGRCELGAVFALLSSESGDERLGYEPTDLAVGVEGEAVTRMLSPLVQNAGRYASSRITLSAERAGTDVHVLVANDGPRLAPALAERVFEPGFRAEPGDGHGGAGLGLALARRLARSADGELDVDVDADLTTFRLRLPAG